MLVHGWPLGIDVSDYQGESINWNAVKAAGVEFAFIKASEGNYHRQTDFLRDWNACKDAGIVRGAYHFLRPGINDAEAEAYWFIDTIGIDNIQEGDILVNDVEAGSNDLFSYVNFWHQLVANVTGFNALLYSRKNFIEEHNLNRPELNHLGLWIANYTATGNPTAWPPIPSAWDMAAFWQYSEKGQIDGISGPVDLNVFHGSSQNIVKYGKPPTTTPVPSNQWFLDAVSAARQDLHKEVDNQMDYILGSWPK